MALIAAHLNAGHSGGECSDRYMISLSPTSMGFSPSLISLMVSVDVKHHVHLLTGAGPEYSLYEQVQTGMEHLR